MDPTDNHLLVCAKPFSCQRRRQVTEEEEEEEEEFYEVRLRGSKGRFSNLWRSGENGFRQCQKQNQREV